MWQLANNEPLSQAGMIAFGFPDRERYNRIVDGLRLEFTLECDAQTNIWSYEFALIDPSGVPVDEELAQYWLTLFFGKDTPMAAKRSYLLVEARYTFPYRKR
jgi:hypothetical protein